MKWENIYIFISSTFNDMHAERDYLIKRVFPELRMWCNEKKLKLIDIDLRWGVSEKDATENKRVVDVCLNNVDKCRPFLLCFLGQRRGWIPGINDINEHTLEQFPALSNYLGKNSITELEVIHGLIHPLNDGESNMRHAFFYYRKPDYLNAITSEEVKHIFQRESDTSASLQDEFELFKDSLKENYDVVDYDAAWNPDKVSPELKNVQGQDLSSGRLDHFHVSNISLANYVLEQLKNAIQEEFPEHFTYSEVTDELEKELNHQDTFLFNACDSYITRKNEEEKILQYFSGEQNKPFIMMANAGTGKTSMLAHLIQTGQISENVFYRFVGTSSISSDIERTLYMLLEEICRAGLLVSEELEKEKSNILLAFPTLLNKIKKKCHIILDAADQWNHLNVSSLRWIPEILPENIKLLISIKSDGNLQIINKLKEKDFCFYELNNMSEQEEKIALIQGYLSQFLKDIDEKQIQRILSLPGSNNPLYLKIVLNELRIHGSFDTLMEQLNKNYGKTPKEAFQMVLGRLEQEIFGEHMDSAELVKYVLGTIGCSTEGVLLTEYAAICKSLIPGCSKLPNEDIMDAVYSLTRHLSPYLVIDGNRVNFLYDSFRQAVNERYKDSYRQFHNILTVLYSQYCYKAGGSKYDVDQPSYLTCYIYHAIECSKNWAESILTDPWFVYSLLQKTSTRKTASYFEQIHKNYSEADEYLDIAKVLNRISARLDIGPNTLFYELKKRIGISNEIVKQLCSKASKVMDMEYYYPVKEEISTGIAPDNELNMYTGSSFHDKPQPYIVGSHIVYIENDKVFLQNIETEEFEKQFKLPRYAYRSYAFRDYLYVHYAGKDDVANGDIEIFKLPTFESVFFSNQRPVLPEGFSWRTFCYGCNGVQYQYAQINNAPYPELYVYNMNTGDIQIHSTFPADTPKRNDYSAHKISFCNEYLVEECSLYATNRLWHVPTATLILEEINDWKCYITCEDDTMWYLSITREKELTCYKYIKSSDQTIQLERKIQLQNKQLIYLEQIGSCNGNLYLFFESGSFWVYNSKLEYVGNQQLQFKLNHYYNDHFTCNQFLYVYNNYIRIMNKPQVLTYDSRTLLNTLKEAFAIEIDQTPYSVIMNRSTLTLLGRTCHTLNLNTFRYMENKQYPKYQYDTLNKYELGYRNYVMGTYGRQNEFYVNMMNISTLSEGLRFHDSYPEGAHILHGAFYKDGILGIVFWDKENYEYTVNKKNRNYFIDEVTFTLSTEVHDNGSHYTIVYYDVRNDFKLIDTWHTEFIEKLYKPSIILVKQIPYLVFIDTYINRDFSKVQVYQAITMELIVSYEYDHTDHSVCGDENIYRINDKILIEFYHSDKSNFSLLEIDPETGNIDQYIFDTRNIVGINDSEVYLFESFYNKVIIYSLKTKSVRGELEAISKRYCYRVVKNQNDLLVFLNGGICEIYDINSLKYKYRQIFLPDYSSVKNCTGTDYIYISTSTSDYSIFAPGNTNMLR